METQLLTIKKKQICLFFFFAQSYLAEESWIQIPAYFGIVSLLKLYLPASFIQIHQLLFQLPRKQSDKLTN